MHGDTPQIAAGGAYTKQSESPKTIDVQPLPEVRRPRYQFQIEETGSIFVATHSVYGKPGEPSMHWYMGQEGGELSGLQVLEPPEQDGQTTRYVTAQGTITTSPRGVTWETTDQQGKSVSHQIKTLENVHIVEQPDAGTVQLVPYGGLQTYSHPKPRTREQSATTGSKYPAALQRGIEPSDQVIGSGVSLIKTKDVERTDRAD